MGLSIHRVDVTDFRSYERFSLRPDCRLTVLAGPNAAGKTNLIEAIQLLTAADSFRKPSWNETVRAGAERAVLSLEASGDGRKLEIRLEVTQNGRRKYSVNGKARRGAGHVAGILPCVIFTPDDLRMVKDSAEKRRGALDSLGGQLSPTYARLKAEYEKILRQRNALLRDGIGPGQLLDPWTERLISVGGALVGHRRRLFDRLASAMAAVYGQLAEDGALTATYVPSWERDGVAVQGTAEDVMRLHLSARAAAEQSRGSTISGPHRDEIVFRIGDAEARAFASQGQQRTVALAWKLAEVEVVSQIASQAPVLLLDDVMSELDERRRHALTSFVGASSQTVITTTNLGYFEGDLLERARVVALP